MFDYLEVNLSSINYIFSLENKDKIGEQLVDMIYELWKTYQINSTYSEVYSSLEGLHILFESTDIINKLEKHIDLGIKEAGN